MALNLPEKITMRCIAMLDTAGGGSMQHYRNEQYGITCTKERTQRGDPFVSAWGMDGIAGTFTDYAALRKAVNKRKE